MATVTEIIPCLLRDFGNRPAAIRYAKRIAQANGVNAPEYREAAENIQRDLDEERECHDNR